MRPHPSDFIDFTISSVCCGLKSISRPIHFLLSMCCIVAHEEKMYALRFSLVKVVIVTDSFATFAYLKLHRDDPIKHISCQAGLIHQQI